MIGIGKYGSSLDLLYRDLVEALKESSKHSLENIQHVVGQVVERYKKGLEASERARKDFFEMRVENWDARVLDPLKELATTHFDKLLENRDGAEFRQKDRVENVSAIDELERQVAELKKQRDDLLNNRPQQAIEEDDLDAFFA